MRGWRAAWRWPRALSELAPARGSLTIALLCVVVFVAQRLAERVDWLQGHSFGQFFSYVFGLHWPLFAAGFFWQPVTYIFLHGSTTHLALNLSTLLLFGSGLEREIGHGRFWRLFLLSGVLGGLGWMAVDAAEPRLLELLSGLPGRLAGAIAGYLKAHQAAGRFGICVGASAGVFGLIGAFAAIFPKREVFVLLLVVPVRLRASRLALLLVIATLVELAINRGQVAYAAHLAGAFAGYLIGRRWAREWPPDEPPIGCIR